MDELNRIKFEQAMSEIRLCVENDKLHEALRAAQHMAMDLAMLASCQQFELGQRAAVHYTEDYHAGQEFAELLRVHRVEWTGKWARAFQAIRAAQAAEAASMESAA